MAQVLGFKLSKEDYLDLAKEAFSQDQVEKGIANLKKALTSDATFTDASLALSNAYASLGAWELANQVLFDALATHPKEQDRNDIYYQLAMNFLDLKLVDTAEYYLRDIADAFGIEIPDNLDEIVDDSPKSNDFKVVYPHGDDYYEKIIENGYRLLRARRFDDLVKLMDEVDAKSKYKNTANHLVLVALMMKNDIDSVIANAQKMLSENEDNLSVKCTLATAYLMEEKASDAYAVLDEILKKDYTDMEDVLMILPILVNMEMHAEVVKYTKMIISTLDIQPSTMMWLSQALYNLGQKDEARRTMVKVRTIFGDTSPADYYLELYAKNPEKVEYSLELPHSERIARYKKLDAFLKMSPVGIQHVADGDDVECENMRKLLNWAFNGDNEQLKLLVVENLSKVSSHWVNSFVRQKLVSVNLSFDLMSRLMFCLVKDNCFRLSFDVVAQDRFKSIEITFPEAFYKMPFSLHGAIAYCYADIVFTDEEPNEYLARLTDIVNALVRLDEKGKAEYTKPKYKKLATLRSVHTLIGVLLCKVYEDEDENMKDITIRRYDLNARTFNKYYDLIFGEEDGRE